MDRAHEPLGPLLSRSASRRGPPRREDPELEAGARAHFEDPRYYSATYARREEDVAYYASIAEDRGAVLEQGIGNGRIALPIARAGVEVTGVDHTRAMLDDLRAQLAREPVDVRRRVRLRHGDVRRVRLRRRFPLVFCAFNTALHFYTRHDVEAWLARTREHLEPGGELVFDISMPIPDDLARDPRVAYRTPPFVHPAAGRVRYREHFDYDRVRQILFVSMFFEPVRRARDAKRATAEQATSEAFMTPLAHRQFFPSEMEALLHYNGYEVIALYGDFDRGPLVQSSDVMVWHARPWKTAR